MKVINILAYKNNYGGTYYSKLISKIESKDFDIKQINLLKNANKLSFFYNAYRNRKVKADITIRDFASSLFLSKKPTKNIVIVHHIDCKYCKFLPRILDWLLLFILIINRNKLDVLVVVSKYWQDYFKNQGFKNIKIIYNAFIIKDFNLKQDDINKFKNKYNLSKKPIIYLGNAQKGKGVDKAYHILKGIDAHFITSGKAHINLPTINLNLSYEEYLLLLKSSSVAVCMSVFKEGWNRVAHEAMLCGTPVVGSGKGGMKELLVNGKQQCANFENLKEKVLWAIENPHSGKKGYQYAIKFDISRFNSEWATLLKSINNDI